MRESRNILLIPVLCVFLILSACSDKKGDPPDGDASSDGDGTIWNLDGDLDRPELDSDSIGEGDGEAVLEGEETEEGLTDYLEIEIQGDFMQGVYPIASERITCYLQELFVGAQRDIVLLTDETDVPVLFFSKDIRDMDFSSGPVESLLDPLDLAISFSMTDPDDYYECEASPDCTVRLNVDLDKNRLEGTLTCPTLVYSLDQQQHIEQIRGSFGCRVLRAEEASPFAANR